MTPTHFETTVSGTRIILDEPALASCTMGRWPIVAAVLVVIAIVLVCIKPTRWHFLAGGLVLVVGPLTWAVSWTLVRTPLAEDEGGVLAIVKDIQFPLGQIHMTAALAMTAVALGIVAIVMKKQVWLRVAACVVPPLAIALVVKTVMCARAVRVAIDHLEGVHAVPAVGTRSWPAVVHPGQPFTVMTELTPVVPKPGGIFGIGARRVDAREWRTLAAYTAQAPGTEHVTLYAERGPVRVETIKDLTVARDEGPSWLPLALGNTWTLIKARGKAEQLGAIEKIFVKNTADPRAVKKRLRVDRETFGDGLHHFVLTLDDGGTTTEATVYRRDGEIVDDKGASRFAGEFPLLGKCRYASAPIDDARKLAGPTVCGQSTTTEHYGTSHGLGAAIEIFTLGAIDTRPTHRYEEGFVLVRSGVE